MSGGGPKQSGGLLARVLLAVCLGTATSIVLEAATISTVEITEVSCSDRFKIRLEGTFDDNDLGSGYDFFRTRIFYEGHTLIHECPCGVEVGGNSFGPFDFWYVFDPPPSDNPLRVEIYEDDDQQLPFGELLKLHHLDYNCLPPTHPIFLDGFELGDTSAWSFQKSCPGPLNPNACLSFVVVGLTVHFSNESTGDQPLSYLWNFGDGSLTSTLENPSHAYASPGLYKVQLTVINTLGTDSLVRPVTVGF